VRLEGLGQLKKIDLIGIRTRDLPACSIVPQPTTLPRAPWTTVIGKKIQDFSLEWEILPKLRVRMEASQNLFRDGKMKTAGRSKET
jgi:hypothetical protein